MTPVEVKTCEETSSRKQQTRLDDAKGRILWNVFWNWASFVFNIAIIFLISPLVVHKLGEVNYGIWSLVDNLVGYSWLLGFGMGYAVVRYVARYDVLGEKDKVNSVVTASLLVNLGSSVLVMAATLGITYVFPRLFSIPQNLLFAARMTVLLVAASIAVGFPASTFTGCVAAASRYDLLGIRSVTSIAMRALSLWYFLERGYGLLTVALISTGATLLGYLIDLAFARQQFPELAIRLKYLNRSLVRPLMNFSLYGFLLAVASRLIYMTDYLVVGFVLGPAAVTFYAVGAKLPGMLRDSLGNIAKLYFPFAAQMDALGKKDGLRRLLLTGTRIISLYVFAGATALALLAPPFLDLWMGKPFGERSGPVLILLAAEVVFYGLTSAAGQVLYGMNRHKFSAWLSLSTATVNFTLSVILVRLMGAVGVAWGTLIPAVVAEGIILPVFTARLLDVPVTRFYFNALLRPLSAAAPFGVWLWLCRTWGFDSSYGDLVVVTLFGLMVYALAAWQFSLDRSERDMAFKWLARTGSKLIAAFA